MISAHTVAPRAGAWIETITSIVRVGPGWVAPRAGAWIETIIYNYTCLFY